MTVRPECIGDRDGEGRMKILIPYMFMTIVEFLMLMLKIA